MSDSPASTLKTPKVIAALFDAGYEVKSTLGEGGFGVVYKARQKSTGQFVAVKLLSETILASRSGDEAAARFEREMHLIADLRHPNLVRLIDTGQLPSGALYTVMEFIEGEELDDIIERGESLPMHEAVRLMGQVLDALCAAHAKGVVHRDLKPANIMITATGGRRNAVVLDFGIAGVLDTAQPQDYRKLTAEGQFFGTPSYMAPEQFDAEPRLTPALDVYAWGLILLECLLGKHVIEGESMLKIVAQHMSPDPVPIPPHIASHPIGTVLRKALQKTPNLRYPSARETLLALESLPLSSLTQLDPMLVPQRGSVSATIDSPAVLEIAASRQLERVTAAGHHHAEFAQQEGSPQRYKLEAADTARDPSMAPTPEHGTRAQNTPENYDEDEFVEDTLAVPNPEHPSNQVAGSSGKRGGLTLAIALVVLFVVVAGVVAWVLIGGQEGAETTADTQAGEVPDETPKPVDDASARDVRNEAPDIPSEPTPSAGPLSPLQSVPAAEVTIGVDKETIREDWERFPNFDVSHDIGLSTRNAELFERPEMQVMRHEVTWGEWSRQIDKVNGWEGLCADTPTQGERADDEPITNVTALEAERFCTSLGMRLPSDREFEALARGSENRRFAMGNDLEDGQRAHMAAENRSELLTWSATPEGVLGLSGGVAEWVRCAGLSYCSDGVGFRGGSFARDPFWAMTWVQGLPPDVPNLACHRADDIGFRCVK